MSQDSCKGSQCLFSGTANSVQSSTDMFIAFYVPLAHTLNIPSVHGTYCVYGNCLMYGGKGLLSPRFSTRSEKSFSVHV